MTEEVAVRIAEALEKISGSIGALRLILGIGIFVYITWQMRKEKRRKTDG